jgi:protein tyrosine phosphatase (PTP) superfamily phosphohydrolase (DUF442 family)
MRQLIASLLLAGMTVACSGEGVRLEDVEGPFSWGAVSNVTHVRNLWLAGQPDAEALRTAKENGLRVVVNLRDPTELDWDERSAVEDLGMVYYNVPIQKTGPFTRESFSRIESLLEDHEGDEILIHCSSSNRVGGWFAVYLVEKHGMSVEPALAIGRTTGITKDGMTRRVLAYLGEPADG